MSLEQRISDGSAVFGVVGLGYVGLPLAVEIAKVGSRVIGIDVAADRVAEIGRGESYIKDVPSEEVAELVEKDLLAADTAYDRLSEVDVVCICVPTPLDDMKEPDTSYIESSAASIAPQLKPGVLVTLESTTYPGTTEEILQPILEAGSGLTVGEDLFLAYSPERVDPGNPVYQTKNTPKVVGGVTEECTRLASLAYGLFIDEVVPVSSTRVAEMTKLLENIFRCVNIALVNELLLLSDRMGIDIWEVIDAARTKPFGFMPFYPGPGLGGHCIPIDPFYLAWKAREYDFHTEYIELAGKTNESMPYHVVSRLMDALNRQKKALSSSKVLLLGVAYKRDIDDVRESPALKIIELLEEKGPEIVYHDPFVTSIDLDGRTMESVPLTREMLADVDIALVVTDHTGVDYHLVIDSVPAILDTRDALGSLGAANVERL
jgi:UDP-N-acetyl-D-glucosamine dehydrogenase